MTSQVTSSKLESGRGCSDSTGRTKERAPRRPCAIDAQVAQPAQRFTPEQFLAFVRKQLVRGEAVHSCYEAGPFGAPLGRRAGDHRSDRFDECLTHALVLSHDREHDPSFGAENLDVEDDMGRTSGARYARLSVQ